MNLYHLHSQSRYSEAVIYNDTVYLAGQLASDMTADIYDQTRQTLQAIDELLAEAASHKSALLTVTIYLKNIERDYAAFNSLWDAWLSDCKAPPRTCVQATLYHPHVLVEITLTAARQMS